MAAEKAELRQMVNTHLLSAADGLAMVDGMERHKWIEMVLEKEVRRRAHAASVVHRVLRGNPYALDDDGERNV